MAEPEFEDPVDSEGPEDMDDQIDEAMEQTEGEEPEDPSGLEQEPEGLDAGDVDESEELTAEDENLLQVKSQIETQLLEAAAKMTQAQVMGENCYEGCGNIVGVGIGAAEDDEGELGSDPGSPVVNVYVVEPASVEEIRATLHDDMNIAEAAEDDTPIRVITTGEIDAFPHRFKMRAAPGGVSVGHFKITAGTLGCLARARTARGRSCYPRGDRRRRVLVLSNNHVLANSNRGRCGDPILQPGPFDGGRNPRDRIALLERWAPINFAGRPNLVDCADGWAWHKLVRKELVYLRRGGRRLFRVSSRPVRCRRGMLVGKSGRTTQLTTGRVIDCSVTIRVNYGGGRVALFRDQIAIRGLRGLFSSGGDSGSLIWTWNRTRNPVGLLFAGGGGYTFGNKIGHVLRALDIRLYT